jgi:hypothetical protein
MNYVPLAEFHPFLNPITVGTAAQFIVRSVLKQFFEFSYLMCMALISLPLSHAIGHHGQA